MERGINHMTETPNLPKQHQNSPVREEPIEFRYSELALLDQ